MKKLLKNKVYGSVNNARMHYIRKTWSTTAARKKKKTEKAERGKRRHANALSKHSLKGSSEIYLFY